MSLRAETLGVSYLDDSSVHEQMVRFAEQLLRGGHLPLTSWFPFLGLGSPQFLHYQSLPSMLTGLIGLAVGGDTAFRWTLYLLLSLWPVSVYLSARLFGAGRPAAAASAAMSPFVMSVTGIGYEQQAYLWVGFGVWTQLWASFTLPLAWGFSWRAIRHGRDFFAAVALVSLTIALHFETGYLALVPLLLWPLVSGPPILRSAGRAAVVIGGSLLASAWVIVPLIEQRAWAATNEILRGTGLVNGYGAGRVLGWLAPGQLLDHGRIPVLTGIRRDRPRARLRPMASGSERPRADRGVRRLPAVVVRPVHVRVAGRRDPRERRHLLPPLHDGCPARRAAARRRWRRLVRPGRSGTRSQRSALRRGLARDDAGRATRRRRDRAGGDGRRAGAGVASSSVPTTATTARRSPPNATPTRRRGPSSIS